MSHLGERLTALVDGELGHCEREKALVHLAGCDQCRSEAEVLRRVKRAVSGLGDVMPGEALMARLQAMGEPGDPVTPRTQRVPGRRRVPPVARPRATRPADDRPRRTSRRRPRARFVVAGAMAAAVLGVGSAAFAAGAEPDRVPRVAPSVEQFAVEHALTSGDIPLTDPRPAGTATESP